VVRFSLGADPIAFRDAVRELLADQCGPSVVRAAWSDADHPAAPAAASPAVAGAAVDAIWQHLAELGLFAAAAPVDRDGLGLNETDLVGVLEEVGYAAVPWPVAETMAVAVPLLVAIGDPAELLADVVAGRTKVALAGPDGAISHGPASNGMAFGSMVPYGRRADLVLWLTGGQVRLTTPGAATRESTVDGSLASVRMGVPTGGVLTDDPDLVALSVDRADLATAAQLVGLGRRMLDLTTAYVATRRQFGVPVGSFQAVKHHLANALLRLEFAAPAVLAAGWALAGRGATRRRDVSMAAILASEAARETAKAAIQCHGAMGYTIEYDLHLYAKRAWALAATCRTDEHLERLADALGLREREAT
jgi:alkylation response protein AidB-like acyl-CoA dehydrogenase